MAKEWPPQNTGRFAPPSCASCCSGPPTEESATLAFVEVYPYLSGLDFIISFTPSARDTETGIVGTGYIRFTDQSTGELGTCAGCEGAPTCYVEETGLWWNTYGWLPTTTTHDVEFYIVSTAEHGTTTDLLVTDAWSHVTSMATNAPDCLPQESFWDSIRHTFTW